MNTAPETVKDAVESFEWGLQFGLDGANHSALGRMVVGGRSVPGLDDSDPAPALRAGIAVGLKMRDERADARSQNDED
mgnify:FL=1|jgi:hypothetical protein